MNRRIELITSFVYFLKLRSEEVYMYIYSTQTVHKVIIFDNRRQISNEATNNSLITLNGRMCFSSLNLGIVITKLSEL